VQRRIVDTQFTAAHREAIGGKDPRGGEACGAATRGGVRLVDFVGVAPPELHGPISNCDITRHNVSRTLLFSHDSGHLPSRSCVDVFD
jgi:hypothetical protein